MLQLVVLLSAALLQVVDLPVIMPCCWLFVLVLPLQLMWVKLLVLLLLLPAGGVVAAVAHVLCSPRQAAEPYVGVLGSGWPR